MIDIKSQISDLNANLQPMGTPRRGRRIHARVPFVYIHPRNTLEQNENNERYKNVPKKALGLVQTRIDYKERNPGLPAAKWDGKWRVQGEI